jgi:hypothetical protein
VTGEFPYRYAWGPRLMGFNRKGQLCRVLARGAMNSCMVEFQDGFCAVISRNALRKAEAYARAFNLPAAPRED